MYSDTPGVNYVHTDIPQPTVSWSTYITPSDPRTDVNQQFVDDLYSITRYSKDQTEQLRRMLDHGHITLAEYLAILRGRVTEK